MILLVAWMPFKTASGWCEVGIGNPLQFLLNNYYYIGVGLKYRASCSLAKRNIRTVGARDVSIV